MSTRVRIEVDVDVESYRGADARRFAVGYVTRALLVETALRTGEIGGASVVGSALVDVPLEACTGCGCLPGDGLTPGCDDPNGCGFFRDAAHFTPEQ